jgi:hypothetical protein
MSREQQALFKIDKNWGREGKGANKIGCGGCQTKLNMYIDSYHMFGHEKGPALFAGPLN